MLPGQVKNQLPVLRKIQPAADLLDLAPGRANVQLLAQRNPHEVINRLKLVFADDLGEAHISGDVSDRSFPEVRHDLIRRSGRPSRPPRPDTDLRERIPETAPG